MGDSQWKVKLVLTVSKMSANFQLNSLEIAEGKALKVNVSVPNTRLFVGNIPKSKSREDIANEFRNLSGNFVNSFFLRRTESSSEIFLVNDVWL